MDWTKINNDSLIITANQRLALSLHEDYNLHKKQQALNLKIKPLTIWLSELHELFTNHAILLTDEQQFILWQTVLAQNQHIASYALNNALIEQIINTWSLMKQWQVPLDELKNEEHLESQFFYQSALNYQQICLQNNWLDTPSLTEIIHNQLSLLSEYLPKQIYLAGFEEIPTALSTLLSTIKQYCKIDVINTQLQPTHLSLNEFNNDDEEINYIADHLISYHKQYPLAKIGLVIPNLTARKNQITKAFKKLSQEQTFRISASPALISYPIISIALKLISLLKSEVETSTLFYLLRSPYFSNKQTFDSLYKLDYQLRQYNQFTFSLREIIAITRNFSELNELNAQLSELISLQKNSAIITNTPKQWSEIFTQLLNIFYWPAEESINSTNFQIRQRFYTLLDHFASTTLIQPTIDLTEALLILTQLTETTLYQPQETNHPIHILGVLEALGQNFDYVWIAGMSEINWPTENNPNPFLSLAIQKKYHMPFSSQHKKQQFFTKITQQLLHMAPVTTVSYVSQHQEQKVKCSPLFKHIAIKNNPATIETENTFKHCQLEYFTDTQGPAFQPQENLEGGSTLFKLQANCPFKAFAQLRLKAKPLPEIYLGLNKQEQGILLHDSLFWIWQEIKTHKKLVSLSPPELTKIIEFSIDKAFTNLIKKMPKKLKTELASTEKNRLMIVINNWLELEKQRHPFTVIQSEKRRKINIKNLELSIQADRIDQLDDGNTVIIDYKTGEYNILDWLSDRFTEPQLPLYCVYHDERISGAVIAEITAKSQRFKGIMLNSENIPGTYSPTRFSPQTDEEAWHTIKSEWRVQLEQLLDDFLAGQATVDPKEAKSCQQCNLQSVCRIYEHN